VLLLLYIKLLSRQLLLGAKLLYFVRDNFLGYPYFCKALHDDTFVHTQSLTRVLPFKDILEQL